MKLGDLARQHQRIGIDSNVVIYALEGGDTRSEAARAMFDLMAEGACRGALSILGLIEILVGPARHAGDALVQRYADELYEMEGVEVVGIDRAGAIESARVRSGGIGLADAIHLATARAWGASAFVTNDRLIKAIPGLEVVQLSKLVLD